MKVMIVQTWEQGTSCRFNHMFVWQLIQMMSDFGDRRSPDSHVCPKALDLPPRISAPATFQEAHDQAKEANQLIL